MPGLPGSAEFMAAYQAALTGLTATPTLIGEARTVAGTVQALVAAYLDCSPDRLRHLKRWPLKPSARAATSWKIFARSTANKRVFRTEVNGRRIMLLTREHMQKIVNEKAGTPFAQRNFLNTVRAMFSWAMKEGRIPDDPTLGVKRVKLKTTGYKTWSEADIERFEHTHPIGTRARLAFALLLVHRPTSQRRGQAGSPAHPPRRPNNRSGQNRRRRGGASRNSRTPEAARDHRCDADRGIKTFLVTHFGKPYTAPGFGNWFREMCDDAGLPERISARLA